MCIEDKSRHKHVYLILSMGLDEHQLKRAKELLVKKFLTNKENIVKFHYNGEDKLALQVIDDIIADYPEVDKRAFELNFKRHGKKLYIKRNNEALLRSSHVICFHGGRMSQTQEKIEEMAEDSLKSLRIWKLDMKKEMENVQGK